MHPSETRQIINRWLAPPRTTDDRPGNLRALRFCFTGTWATLRMTSSFKLVLLSLAADLGVIWKRIGGYSCNVGFLYACGLRVSPARLAAQRKGGFHFILHKKPQ